MFRFTNRNVLQLLAMATFLHICQARSLANDSSTTNATDGVLWQPKEGTMEEWMVCHGMPKDVCERIKVKKEELQKALAKQFGLDYDPTKNDSDEDQCMVFSEEQLDMMIAEAKKEEGETSRHRKKRTLIDFKQYTDSKWSMPVPFKFYGDHDDNQKATIRRAFQHWSDNTCVRFKELPTNADFNSNHILMTRDFGGCWSQLGRTPSIPQQINLASYCVDVFGTVLHEIGHSLGLVHEQSRLGRDESVEIIWSNIDAGSWSQYAEASYTDALGLPYNYGSVMHYSSKYAPSQGDTMIAKDRLYQMNMGQRSDLSFHDRKIINLAYCTGTCTTPLTQPCQRGGYQNPNKCSTCICPDGFSGQFCNEIAPPQNANCGGILNIVSGTEQVIKSPGYDTTGYAERQECTWWIKAPQNHKLELEFGERFSIVCSVGSACVYHWVEVKYKKDLGSEGARFCCYNRPDETVISESNEMMVIFRSNYSVDPQSKTYQRGFQATVKSIPPVSSSSSSSTSTPASIQKSSIPAFAGSSSTLTSSSTTSASTTTTTTTTTTKSPTTIKSSTSTKTTPSTTTSATTSQATPLANNTMPIGNQESLFRCSFENSASGDSLCGMTQDPTDQFDWTVYKGPTPSDPTGPDFPHDGNFYIYIEASEPRQPNDTARLFFPKMNFAGDVCVDFYYHMYGFHINTLKLVKITGSQSTDVWSKTGQIGNFWLHASVGVNLSTNSQLQFVGIRGQEFSGDIGLDKIEVKSGSCAV